MASSKSASVGLALTLLVAFAISVPVFAQRKARTGEGREVLLYDDGTWKYAAQLQVRRSPKRLKTPPFRERLRKGAPPATPIKLKKLSDKRNNITDDEQWFAKHELALPVYEVPNGFRGIKGNLPDNAPATVLGEKVIRAMRSGDRLLLVYGVNYSSGRYLLVTDAKALKVFAFFDFATYMRAPRTTPGDEMFVHQDIAWAAVEDGTLYISHAHRTYAKSSKGENAYLSAVDLETGDLLWRSRPLVANAASFEIIGDVIVSGYGFTAEKDNLFLINKHSGAVLKRIPLKSGPSFILRKNDRLHVRTYNRDYVFAITPTAER